jgi:hypothetical protein
MSHSNLVAPQIAPLLPGFAALLSVLAAFLPDFTPILAAVLAQLAAVLPTLLPNFAALLAAVLSQVPPELAHAAANDVWTRPETRFAVNGSGKNRYGRCNINGIW